MPYLAVRWSRAYAICCVVIWQDGGRGGVGKILKMEYGSVNVAWLTGAKQSVSWTLLEYAEEPTLLEVDKPVTRVEQLLRVCRGQDWGKDFDEIEPADQPKRYEADGLHISSLVLMR